MKPIKETLKLDEYQQAELNNELWDTEMLFYKKLYYEKFNSFINILIDKYKTKNLFIQFELEASGFENYEYDRLVQEKIPVHGIEWKGTSTPYTMTSATLPIEKGYLVGWNTSIVILRVICRKYKTVGIFTQITQEIYPALYPNPFNETEIEEFLISTLKLYEQ